MATEEDAASVDVSGSGAVLPQNERSELEVPSESRCLSFCQTLCVQWENAQALCWLDCILSALVHLEGLKNTVNELCSKEECVFWRLFGKYNQANELLYTHHLHGVKGGNCEKLTSEIFAEIETCLNEVRDEIFTKLQPQLRCTLGEMESPVFALPLLLKIEPHIEKLFIYSFSWNFECSQCGHQYQNRCLKNLVTFTNVVPEWHPLNAAHFGPCNSCNSKSQIRKMVLEIVSPLFMLHFVEGLPRSDLQHYEFQFEGSLYQITCVIQYQASNHFITWILDGDGSWLECDDLKGPCAKRHEEFGVPASEIHIVIWERKMFQVVDKEAACLPLKKHTLGEKPASPALCSMGETAEAETSVTYPTHLSVAPQTFPQDKAEAKGLVDSILPLTLEGTIQEAASVFQIASKDFLSEGNPVTENISLVKANTLPSQEPLMTSLLSNLCKEKVIHAQFVDVSFPSQVVNTNMQSIQAHAEDAAVPKSVTNVHAPGGVQEVKSVETEDTQLRFLPLQTEKLKPEQHSTPQVSNLKNKATTTYSKTVTAKSSQNRPLKENQKKPFVGSWVKGLLSRGASFMPPCVSAQNRNSLADLQPSVKGANNFDGFKTKSVSQKASWVSKKACECVAEASPVSSSTASGSTAAFPRPCGNGASELLKKQECSSDVAHLSHNSHRNENSISLVSHGASAEDQIHKLRLKLLKKLKAKKKKLAALTSSPQNGTLPSENLEAVSHCGSPNDSESIEDLLNELQYQIDLADNKAGCTTVPSVTSYNSQSHEDILAELLSPTTVSTELSENVESDFRYLEMGDDNSTPAPVPSELNGISKNTHLKQDHNYCSPTKKNQCEVQPGSLTDNPCIRALNLESPVKADIFDEFFSTSALNSLTNDTLDLPHFDEYLFETC
ncbi:SUMO-specific isopeptidase USPL1 isoform X2 [Nannospalax galili]|nr:SUMO-specific isopeptidase USPL1 isoform X2 [Nannospalax galili]XP_029415500.1 SUMO-specific isopeptidase USPL1 isoform X2 [Nannospalax galili]XP_029415501.1 SUMO-specific isopeptidase USPL1 isoform X2 [Nannospalax galili]XP_029415502.1 SUMO-specific isopeptidase USPL1 isoform X2 [Nannospalax galili]